MSGWRTSLSAPSNIPAYTKISVWAGMRNKIVCSRLKQAAKFGCHYTECFGRCRFRAYSSMRPS